MRISDWSSDVCSSDLSSPAASSTPCASRSALAMSSSNTPASAQASISPGVSRGRSSDGDCAPSRSTRYCSANSRSTSPPSPRSEEHTSELQSLMRISYAVFCLKKKNTLTNQDNSTNNHKHNNIHNKQD